MASNNNKNPENAFDVIKDRLDVLCSRMDKLEENITEVKSKLKAMTDTDADKEPEDRESITDEILAEFDFERVEDVMKHLNWTWASVKSGAPTSKIIKSEAERLLNEAWLSLDGREFDAEGWREYICATGGLEAWVCEGNETHENRRIASLKFVVEDWRVDR